MSEKKVSKPLKKEQIDELADKIYQLFKKNDMWMDSRIYFNGGCIDNKDEDGHYHYDGSVYYHPNMNPRDYFDYVNPDHILSMSFEGPIYHMFNYNEYRPVLRKFNSLLARYGLCYELGNAWNLSCYYE